MEMVGEARLEASRELVWDALNDATVLRASIPGCEELDRTSDSEYTAKVVSKVGPIKARFAGKVSLSNVVPQRGYTMTGEGQGGAAGFVKTDIEVSLEALEPSVTLLRYGVKAQVGGKLAQLGSRMVDSAARRNADEFFEKFGREVGRRAGALPTPSVESGRSTGLAALVAAAGPSAEATTAAEAGAASGSAALPAAGPAAAVAGSAVTGASSQIPVATAAQALSPDLADVWVADEIKVWIADQIAVVTLNRPKNRNAMTSAMWKAIPALFAALERNPEVRAVVLTGAGEDFCSGADIPEFERVRADTAQATAYEVAVDACCDAIANIAKPTIAVVRGYCLGGGAHLAMSCDFRYASADAKFGIPAARLSIIYGVKATQKLRSLVGLTQAKKILYGAERFDAREALRIGFVDHVSGLAPQTPRSFWGRITGANAVRPVVGDPMADARALARSIAANAPLSVAGAKYILNGVAMGTGALDPERAEAMIAHAAGSEDYREGRAAFAEKRPPAFKGR